MTDLKLGMSVLNPKGTQVSYHKTKSRKEFYKVSRAHTNSKSGELLGYLSCSLVSYSKSSEPGILLVEWLYSTTYSTIIQLTGTYSMAGTVRRLQKSNDEHRNHEQTVAAQHKV